MQEYYFTHEIQFLFGKAATDIDQWGLLQCLAINCSNIKILVMTLILTSIYACLKNIDNWAANQNRMKLLVLTKSA